MLSNDRKEILLMNPVRVSLQSSKYKAASNRNKESSLSESWYADADLMTNVGIRTQNINVWDGVPFSINRQIRSRNERIIAEMWLKLRMMFVKKPDGSPSEFFENVKSSLKTADISVADEEEFKKKLEILEKSKQSFAAKQLDSDHQIALDEKKATSAGFDRVITEQDLIKFIKRSRKGLCLQELDYFKYDIPANVAELIFKADSALVFDNFYVLHYDPNAKINMFYEKEKDPIVFGVIRGSKKLFFIADWISEYCDLTYGKLLQEIK